MPAKRPLSKKTATPKRKRGRPSKFTPELADEICARLSKGEPLAAICRDEHMPGVTAVWDWTQNNPKFSESIARARRDGGHAIANNARETARGRGDSTGDYLRDKLIIDTDLKLLSKWFPKDYGDKLDVSASIQANVVVEIGGDTK
jgi:hypothetical protein